MLEFPLGESNKHSHLGCEMFRQVALGIVRNPDSKRGSRGGRGNPVKWSPMVRPTPCQEWPLHCARVPVVLP